MSMCLPFDSICTVRTSLPFRWKVSRLGRSMCEQALPCCVRHCQTKLQDMIESHQSRSANVQKMSIIKNEVNFFRHVFMFRGQRNDILSKNHFMATLLSFCHHTLRHVFCSVHPICHWVSFLSYIQYSFSSCIFSFFRALEHFFCSLLLTFFFWCYLLEVIVSGLNVVCLTRVIDYPY